MPAQTTRAVASGDVTISGPNGYCIDRSSARDGADGAFLFFSPCTQSLAASETTPDVPPVLLTALVSTPLPEGSRATPADLDRYLRSNAGRAVLAQDGDPKSATILITQTRGDVLYLRVRDTSNSQSGPLATDAWRAVFPVNGRIVALSAKALAEQPVASSSALSVLRQFVDSTTAANTEPEATSA
ncbi:MAG: hypothetical protein AAGF71_07085 [Pseudomonadota bacterium]